MWIGSLKLQNTLTKEVVFVTKQSEGDRIMFGLVDSDYTLLAASITNNGIAHPVRCLAKVVPKNSSVAITDLPKREEFTVTSSVSGMTALDKVVIWNTRRNLTSFNLATELRMLDEELQELTEAVTDHQRVDALCDLIVLAAGAIHKLGYSPELAMLETVKEINSRQGSINPTTGKWEKRKDQDPSTLYTANYDAVKY